MNLVETTQLNRHSCPIEITYDKVSDFIYHEFKYSLIQKQYGIHYNPISLVSPTSNEILERIHLVIDNLFWTYNAQDTYIDKGETWFRILAASAFTIHSITNRLKGYTPVQLIFGNDFILPIENSPDWVLICQVNKAQINKYNNQENIKQQNRITKLVRRSF